MSNSLNGALPIMARYFCDDIGVEVIHGAKWPHTRNRKIYLPNLVEEEGVVTLGLAFTSHESAHIKYSDPAVYDMAGNEPPFVGRFMNALEDIRIEKRMMADHCVARPWLSYSAVKVLGGPVTGGQSEAAVLHNACLLMGRALHLNQPLHTEAEAYRTMLRETFGPGRSVKVLALLSKVAGQPDTMAIYHLTHQILDVLDEEEPDEDPQDDSGDQSGSGGQQNQNQQPGNGPEGDDDDGDPGQGSGATKPGDDDQVPGSGGDQSTDPNGDPQESPSGEGVKQNSDSGNSSGNGGDSDGSHSLKEKILSTSKAECDELKSDLGDGIASLLKDKIDRSVARPAPLLKQAGGSDFLGPQTVAKGRAASAGLKQVLLGLMQGAQQARPVPRRTGKSVDATRLARVPVGEVRVFRRTDPVQRVNAAFEILLDASSSMGTAGADGIKPLRHAEEATCALLSALDGIQGVTTGAMVFPRSGPEGSDSVGVLKRHDQSFNQAVNEKRFGLTDTGCTPLAEAIWPAAGDLLAAKGQRKVLVLITDGEPDNQDQAKTMIDRCRKSGIEVFCIGFGSISASSMNTVFGTGNWKYLEHVGLMRDALSQLVKNVLTNKAA